MAAPFEPPQPPPPPPAPAVSSVRGLTTWTQDADDDFVKGTYAVGTPNLIEPIAVRMSEAKYTAMALRAKLSGTVDVEAVVAANGAVARARPAKNGVQLAGQDLYPEAASQLVEQAVLATEDWLFKPGFLDGKAVPVLVHLQMQFRIH